MAQNTALQTLFDELEKLGENYSEPFKEFHLSNERQQVIDAHKAGAIYGMELQVELRKEGKFPNKENAEQYFTNTFNQ